MDAITSIAVLVSPVMRSAHASERRSIMYVVETEKMTPTMPEPELALEYISTWFVDTGGAIGSCQDVKLITQQFAEYLHALS